MHLSAAPPGLRPSSPAYQGLAPLAIGCRPSGARWGLPSSAADATGSRHYIFTRRFTRPARLYEAETALPPPADRDALHGLLVQGQLHLHERAIVLDLQVGELRRGAVEHDARVLGDAQRPLLGVLAARHPDRDGDRPLGGVHRLEQARQAR